MKIIIKDEAIVEFLLFVLNAQMRMGCSCRTAFITLCLILILIIGECQTVIVQISEYTIRNVHGEFITLLILIIKRLQN